MAIKMGELNFKLNVDVNFVHLVKLNRQWRKIVKNRDWLQHTYYTIWS